MSQFFWCCALLCCSWLATANCPSLLPDEIATVARVIDGDTLVLQDSRVIRLNGIDTPELNNHKARPQEPGAVAAKVWLQNKMPANSRVKLVFGRQPRDAYGRWLAHPLTVQGDLLVKQMLELGLGSLLQIPPNHNYWSCLLAAEQSARQRVLGIWGQGLAPLTRSAHRGLYHTRVVRADKGKRLLELQLAGNISLRAGSRLPAQAKLQLRRLKSGDRLFIRGPVVRRVTNPASSTEQAVVWINQPWQFYLIP